MALASKHTFLKNRSPLWKRSTQSVFLNLRIEATVADPKGSGGSRPIAAELLQRGANQIPFALGNRRLQSPGFRPASDQTQDGSVSSG